MQALTFFFAFVAVLVLIGVVTWLVRRFAGNRMGTNSGRGRMPRLAVIDAAAVDGRRRLVLVRRDNVEHLLMIGGPTDIVVEPNIVRASPGRDQTALRPNVGADAPRPAPLPDAGSWNEDSTRLEAPEPIAPEPPPTRPVRPSFSEDMRRAGPITPERRDPLAVIPSEPLARPQPRPDLRAEPPVRQASRAEPQIPRPPVRENAAAKPSLPARPAEAPPIAPPSASPPSSTADQNLAEMAQRLEAALRRPGEARPNTAETGATPPSPPRPASRPATDESPGNAPRGDTPGPKTASPKDELDNLENEMASLLGRPKSPS